MKIPASASVKVVYVVVVHPHLGPLIEPYVVQITSAGNLSMVHQKVNRNNAEAFDKALVESDYQAIEILDQCTPENIVKKFSKVKRIRPSEFYSKYLTKELFKEEVQPFVELCNAQVIELIRGKLLYRKAGKDILAQQIDWPAEPASVLYHLRKNPDNTHYFATIKHDNHRVQFAQNNAILLSKNPCYLVTGSKLLHFNPGFDGQKLVPFITKRFIAIPKANEDHYFEKVIAPLIENNPLYAVGIDVQTHQFKATPELELTRLEDDQVGFRLNFLYGPHRFPSHPLTYVSVVYDGSQQVQRFYRIKRSRDWEEIKTQTLELFGAHPIADGQFTLEGVSTIEDLITWVTAKKVDLDQAGFEILQRFDETYTLVRPEIEWTATQDGDWFDVKAKIKLGGYDIPITRVREALRKGANSIQLPNGEYAIIPQEWIEQLSGLAIFSQSEQNLKINRQHAGLISPLFDSAGGSSGFDFESFTGIQDAPVSGQFNGALRPYQKAGYDWLVFLRNASFGGCLADDMGLGKTVQTLAFLQYVCDQNASAKSLLIVPTSLIHNWQLEIHKFTPKLRVLIHMGSDRVKNSEAFQMYNLILTTYGTIRNDIELFQDTQFETIVLDESQFIKNPRAKLPKLLNNLNGNTKLTLTGTPIENSISDLWSQMNFTNPGLLGTFNFFKKEFITPIEKGVDTVKANQLQQLIKPFVLRRTKMQVAKDLPPKLEQIVYCDMDDDQRELYEQTKSTYRNMILDNIAKNGLGKSKIQLLTGLTKLRQIANHPRLLEPESTHTSGKFYEVEERLKTALNHGHSVLIFSQFVNHLQLVKELLDAHGIVHAYLDGSSTAIQRKKSVQSFQNGEVSVFLISLKAGGFGLNLTAADYVFLLDPWWNPAAEQQAIDRTHRIGQTKQVVSYKFITSHTVEEKIVALQHKKKRLSDSIITTEESYIKQVTVDDIKQIFDQ